MPSDSVKAATKPKCFVIMGYGEKTDFATGRKLNLDATYKNIIKPAVQEGGYECIRADEIRHSGMIDVPMYDMLFDADLVVADLSTSNVNAAFELGIRHALKPRSTIVMAETQFTSPFDINHIAMLKYVHLGSDIGYGETMLVRDRLKDLIAAIGTNERPDSPVYTLLDLIPPDRRKAAPTEDASVFGTVQSVDSYAGQFKKAMTAKTKDDGFEEAYLILKEIYDTQRASENAAPRPRVVQELALATYKRGEKRETKGNPGARGQGYDEALELLGELDPTRTTDPETLGLWAAIHKRIAERANDSDDKRRAHLKEAIFASERGFLIRQDYYTGTNLAYLLNYRAFHASGHDQIADRVLANRVRERIIDLAQVQLKIQLDLKAQLEGQSTDELDVRRKREIIAEEIFWLKASLAEAKIGLGMSDMQQAYERAIKHFEDEKLPLWMPETMQDQIRRLLKLLPGETQEKIEKHLILNLPDLEIGA